MASLSVVSLSVASLSVHLEASGENRYTYYWDGPKPSAEILGVIISKKDVCYNVATTLQILDTSNNIFIFYFKC